MDQYRSIRINGTFTVCYWSVLIRIDRHWSSLIGIDRPPNLHRSIDPYWSYWCYWSDWSYWSAKPWNNQVLLDDGNRIILPQGNFNVYLLYAYQGNITNVSTKGHIMCFKPGSAKTFVEYSYQWLNDYLSRLYRYFVRAKHFVLKWGKSIILTHKSIFVFNEILCDFNMTV